LGIKKGNEKKISMKKLCRPAIFVPPQELTCSGSKGIISAQKSTPKDIFDKGRKKSAIFVLFLGNINFYH
jgi:hypothetical protein